MALVIGGIAVDPPLVLAPMEGVTDRVFRRLIRQIGGCGLTVTEFIPAQSLVNGVPQFLRMAEFDPDEHPIAIQIYGNEPEVLAAAAKFAEDKGADILDLNMGCPSKKVCQNSGGSGLMRDPELCLKIVRAMRASVSIPFTVKMRAGWDREHLNAPDLAWMCQEEGVDAVTVHWRTREEKYGGERDLSVIREVVERVSIPVLANGDIVDVESAMRTWKETGVQGLMIGRGAIRDPWVFRSIATGLDGGTYAPVSMDERERLLMAYYEALRPNFNSEKAALGRMKKIARYFTDGVVDGDRLRQDLFHSQTIDEAYDRIREFFEGHRTSRPTVESSSA
jgi:tRNA-dihydrouridine synthase B